MAIRNPGSTLAPLTSLNATAHEFDVYNAAGCSVKWNWGINIVSFNAVQGSSNDAAIVIYSGNLAPSNGNNYGPGVGFHNGLCFAEIDSTADARRSTLARR